MFRSADCQKYRQWKREQAMKSKDKNKKVKKTKPKDPVSDCIDEDEGDDEVKETTMKISYRKCKKKKRRRKIPRNMAKYVYKRISLSELVLKNIKPSIKTRTVLINPRHTICFPDNISQTDISQKTAETRRCGKKEGGRMEKVGQNLETDDSECSSICSFDSEIFLAGLKLTRSDLKKIEDIRKRNEEPNKDKD